MTTELHNFIIKKSKELLVLIIFVVSTQHTGSEKAQCCWRHSFDDDLLLPHSGASCIMLVDPLRFIAERSVQYLT